MNYGSGQYYGICQYCGDEFVSQDPKDMSCWHCEFVQYQGGSIGFVCDEYIEYVYAPVALGIRERLSVDIYSHRN